MVLQEIFAELVITINIHRQSQVILSKNPIDRLNKYIKKPFHSMFTLVKKRF